MGEVERRTIRSVDWQRVGKALLWAVAGSVTAPFAFAAEVAIIGMARGEGIAVVPIALWVSAFSILATIMYALVPYCAVLIGWAIMAPTLGAADRSRRALVLVTGLLAVPAGLTGLGIMAGLGVMEDGSLYLGATLWLAAWVGLLIPRLLLEQLRPGVFAANGIDPYAA